jgi:leucyl/phenylalanyl-tRNA--protein transferase
MSNRSLPTLTPDILLRAYAAGVFPMAESAASTRLHWFDPPIRAIIPLDEGFHVPHRLKRSIRQIPYNVKLNTAFREVIRACASPALDREITWINHEIIYLYGLLHQRGFAHSIEVWNGDELVGGLYGVSLGSAFFGESMFSRKTNASKIALVYLVNLLRSCGFSLLDTQFQTSHLTQFGTHEITRANYQLLLNVAIKKPAKLALPTETTWDHLVAESLQPVTQIS